jgi:sterol desaturase/sphingolipid hydroxylase (fatty acid hydroxylase superfamily)
MFGSSSSTVCSTPENDSVGKVFKNDKVRYQRKGYGLFFALVLSIAYFHYFPQLIKEFWPSLLEKYSVKELFIVINFSVHTGIYAISNLVMYAIYKMKLPFFENYRILDKPWPWESDPAAWKVLFKKSMRSIAITHFVIAPLFLFLETRNEPKMRFDVETFPDTWEILKQIFFFMLVEDFLFYWHHRMLHHPKIYPYIHKIHHEYNITVSISAEYAHPLEFILGNVLPANIGPKILGSQVHFITYNLWIIVRLLESVDGHSGYEFSWSPYRLLPLSSSSSYHNFHHSHNVGNFGSLFTFWDSFCGTNKRFYQHQARKEKKELAVKIQRENDNLASKNNTDTNNLLAKQLEKNLNKVVQGSDKSS